MSDLKVFNTLTREKETFAPLVPGEVRMYSCGPTVYNHLHIGNMRTFVWGDVLRRYLEWRGLRVKQVMNITDVEDKIIRNAAAAGKDLQSYTAPFIESFHASLQKLRVRPADAYPRATEYIPQMVALVQQLSERGHTYVAEGSTYFKVSTMPDYGKLSRVEVDTSSEYSRVESDEYEKESARDFVLWKAKKENEPAWQTPIGEGRPGWHLECSAMSMDLLGETFDIHTGAVDLIFPHHENEIAQSEGATGKPFVRYWIHGEHLNIDQQKMSKSLGNIYTVPEIEEMNYDLLALRYALLSVPYRTKLNFTTQSLDDAKNALTRIESFLLRIDEVSRSAAHDAKHSDGAADDLIGKFLTDFETAMDDDLNTASALGALFMLIREGNTALDDGRILAGDAEGLKTALMKIDPVLDIFPKREENLDAEIEALIAARNAARKARNFAESDRIRDELVARGILLEDTRRDAVAEQVTDWRDPRQWPPSLKAAAGLIVLALASAIAGHFVYRRFIVAVLIGALVGTGEIVSRYRDAPERALWTMSALLYILINAAASCAALYVIWRFHVAVTADNLRTIITQTLMAGFGAMAFFRTSLFIVRVGEQDVAIGPVAFLQVVLNATDRAVDRVRAEARAVSVTDSMEGVSFDRAWTALPAFCFTLMQNVPAEEQKAAAAAVTALKGSDIDNETKVKNLGLLLLNVVGTKVLQTAVNELAQQIRKTVEIAIVNAPYSMSVGQFADAHAKCTDTKGIVLEGRAVTWSSDDTKTLTVTASGRVTALAKGTAVVRAVSDDATAAIRILVDAASAMNIEELMAGVSFERAHAALPLYCLNLTQNMGTNQQKDLSDSITMLKASTLDNDAKAVNLGLHLLNIFGSGVLVTALKGLAQQIQKTATITLDGPPIPEMHPGDVFDIQAICEDVKGNPLTGRAPNWSSDNQSVVKITPTGSVTAALRGTTAVRAASDEATRSWQIVVS